MEALKSGEAAILDRVMRPDAGGWPRAAAKAVLAVTFGARDRSRMSLLMEKAGAENLSPKEAGEAGNYRQVGRLLELMKSRARRSLRNAS